MIEATSTQAATPLWFIQNLAWVKEPGEETGGWAPCVGSEGAQGGMPPLHVPDADEAFYVLEGELSIFLPGRQLRLTAGDCVVAPRDVPHVYRVESDKARWLGITSPPG